MTTLEQELREKISFIIDQECWCGCYEGDMSGEYEPAKLEAVSLILTLIETTSAKRVEESIEELWTKYSRYDPECQDYVITADHNKHFEEMCRGLEGETIITDLEMIDKLVKQSANLSLRGYKVKGAGKIDGEISVVVESEDDTLSLQNLIIDANLLENTNDLLKMSATRKEKQRISRYE